MRLMISCASMVAVGMIAGDRCRAASVVIDQQNTSSNGFVRVSSVDRSFGQSFTPTLNAIDFATFELAVSSTATYRVDLFAGSGYGGTLLGSSTSETPKVRESVSDRAQLEFDFATPIALTPGSIYSLGLVRLAGTNELQMRANLDNPYNGGTLLNPVEGVPNTAIDLVFSEGLRTPSAVPAPSSLAGSAVGLAAMGLWMRRKSAAA